MTLSDTWTANLKRGIKSCDNGADPLSLSFSLFILYFAFSLMMYVSTRKTCLNFCKINWKMHFSIGNRWEIYLQNLKIYLSWCIITCIRHLKLTAHGMHREIYYIQRIFSFIKKLRERYFLIQAIKKVIKSFSRTKLRATNWIIKLFSWIIFK